MGTRVIPVSHSLQLATFIEEIRYVNAIYYSQLLVHVENFFFFFFFSFAGRGRRLGGFEADTALF
jgi:hypothetical protein